MNQRILTYQIFHQKKNKNYTTEDSTTEVTNITMASCIYNEIQIRTFENKPEETNEPKNMITFNNSLEKNKNSNTENFIKEVTNFQILNDI